MKIFKYAFLPLIGIFIGYVAGHYSGMNEIFLCETTLSAGSNIHVLKYIDSGQIDKAKSVISTSLEAEMAAVHDITANKYRFSKAVSLYNHYRTMIALNTSERINNLKDCYEVYASDSKTSE